MSANLLELCYVRGEPVPTAALIYAALGWPVFPCKGKHPLTHNGFLDATTDEAQIVEWWTRNPNANIAWALAPGLIALDVDPRHGGDKSVAELQREHGALPLTLEQVTGSGGEHRIFTIPAGVALAQKTAFRPGLDTRIGGKGYLMAAPSIHPDTRTPYWWRSIAAPVEIPGWLAAIVTAPAAPERKPYTPPAAGSLTASRRERYARAALANISAEVARTAEGSRNDQLNKAWWRMCGFRDVVSESETRAVLLEAALASGIPQSEAEKVLR